MVVERFKTLPPPRTRTGPLAFFGNWGGCFQSCKKTKKCVALRPKLPILSVMEISYTTQESRKASLRNTYLATYFQHLLETAEFSLPLSVTAEQEQAFKKALAERIAKGKASAEQFAEEYSK